MSTSVLVDHAVAVAREESRARTCASAAVAQSWRDVSALVAEEAFTEAKASCPQLSTLVLGLRVGPSKKAAALEPRWCRALSKNGTEIDGPSGGGARFLLDEEDAWYERVNALAWAHGQDRGAQFWVTRQLDGFEVLVTNLGPED